MATKPKEKPETAPKKDTSSNPAPKSASKTASKTTSKTAQTTSVTAEKGAETPKTHKQESAVSDPKSVDKAVCTYTQSPMPESHDVESETHKSPTGKPVSKTGAKPPVKPEPASPKVHKWHEIKIILEKMKEDILIEIEKSVKNGTDAVATNEPGGDIYDQASSERDRELGLLLGDREREKLHSVDEALLRIDENEYGICEECDEDIPLGRLKAMPFTRHCVKCKSDLEKLQAQTKRFEEDRAYREIPLGSEEEEA